MTKAKILKANKFLISTMEFQESPIFVNKYISLHDNSLLSLFVVRSSCGKIDKQSDAEPLIRFIIK